MENASNHTGACYQGLVTEKLLRTGRVFRGPYPEHRVEYRYVHVLPFSRLEREHRSSTLQGDVINV